MLHDIAYANLFFTLLKQEPEFLPTAFAVLCIIMFHWLVFLGAVGLFRSNMLLIFNMVWPWFSCGTVCVCLQLPYRGNDMIFWIFPISLVTRFACDIIGLLARIWIWVPSEVFTILVSIWISVEQLITSKLATPCWWDPTRSKQLSTVANVGFQSGLYHVAAPLSFLRSISLASLFVILKPV